MPSSKLAAKIRVPSNFERTASWVRFLVILGLGVVITTCGNSNAIQKTLSMDYPDWNEKESNDRLNIVSMVRSDRQCFFDLSAADIEPEAYRKIAQDFMAKKGSRILENNPLSYEFDTPDGSFTFLAKTRTVPCGKTTYLATVTCVKNQFDTVQAERLFASMQCDDPTGSGPASVPAQTTVRMSASGTPKLGIVVSPQGKFNHTNVSRAFEIAAQAGSQITRHYLSWTDVETGNGTYEWKGSDYMIGRARAAGLRLTVAFHVIRTAIRGPRPADLESLDWSDPELIERFSKMVSEFLYRYENIVDYVEIGSEVNAYFQLHPDEVDPFITFFSTVHKNLSEKHPNISVGTVFAYHEMKKTDDFTLYHRLNIGDHDGFTLYLFEEDFAHTGSPQLVYDSLNEIAALTENRRFALEEIGWTASPELASSDSAQQEAVQFMFDFVENAPDRLEFITWFTLHDMQASDCDNIAKSFSRQGDELSRNSAKMELFSHFLCNFGLRRNDGTARPAWDTWVKRAQDYLER